MATPEDIDIGQGQYVRMHPAPGVERARFLCLHGGGGVDGSPAVMDTLCGAFARTRKITMMAASYRTLNRDQATLEEMQADAAHALDWACRALPKGVKLYLLGASFGGLLALLAFRHAPAEVQAQVAGLVLLNPVVDTGPGGFANRVIPKTGRTDVDPMRLFDPAQSPPAVPCLMLHGTADAVVPVEAARRFAALWTGAPCTLFEVTNAPHGFFNRRAEARNAVRRIAPFAGLPTGDPTPDDLFPDGAVMLFGIGAQKAGTSWLYDYLGQSPECLLNDFKEVHYFDVLSSGQERSHMTDRVQHLRRLAAELSDGPGGDDGPRLNAIRRLSELLTIFTGDRSDHSAYVRYMTRRHRKQKVVADITPAYGTLDRSTYAQMAAIGQARFVFILRDPVDRLWSQTRMAVSETEGKTLSGAAFEAACIARVARIEAEGRLGKVTRADYIRTMTELEAAVPAERIHYAFYEELFTQASGDRLCAFLGLTPVPVASDRQVNVGRVTALPPETETIIFRALRRQYEAVFERFGTAVPEAWRTRYDAGLALLDGPAAASSPTRGLWTRLTGDRD